MIAAEYMAQKHEPFGACKVSVTFGMPMPKQKPLYWKRAALAGEIPHTKRPDTDNLLKSVLDGLQKGGAFNDDCSVTGISACKVYAAEPFVDILIYDDRREKSNE